MLEMYRVAIEGLEIKLTTGEMPSQTSGFSASIWLRVMSSVVKRRKKTSCRLW